MECGRLVEDEVGSGSVPMVEKKRVELKAIQLAYEGLPPEVKSNGMVSSFALAGYGSRFDGRSMV
jgi:hypothetical protein